jgi:hypothetical protein
MSDSHKSDSSRRRLKLHIFSLGLLWTAVFYAGFVWNILHEGENTVLVVYILLWLTGLTGIILVGKRFQEHSQAEENLMRQHRPDRDYPCGQTISGTQSGGRKSHEAAY